MSHIHPLAVVDACAQLGNEVCVGPFCVVGPHVVLGDGVTLKSHVVVDGYTTIGKGTVVWPGAVIGAKPQDLKYKGEKTFVFIGENCEIREYVTVNAACGDGQAVFVGNNCLIMAYCHVAHNSTVGNRVILANGATLAGYVTVEDAAIVGGLSAVHQFARIGRHAMVGGMSRVTHDVPPYTIGAGSPYRLGGLNIVGLKRHGILLQTRIALAKAFKLLYRSGLPLEEALNEIEEHVDRLPEVQHWLDFCRSSKRGLISDRVQGREEEQ
jgi:UDP-N-acetylglucosamine acyltransferase